MNADLARLRRERLDALRRLGAERELDAVILFAQGGALGAATRSHAYLRMFLDWDSGEQASLLVLAGGRLTLVVTNPFQLALAARLPDIDATIFAPPAGIGSCLAALLAEAGVPHRSAIGTVGWSELPQQGWISLTEALPLATLTDLAPVLDLWRSHKEAAEVAALERAAGLCDLLFDRVDGFLAEGRPGWMTQRDLEHLALLQGAEHCRTWLTIAPEADGPRYFKPECERVPQRGDQVLLGLMLKRDGYWGHAIRMGAFGEARPAHLRLHALVLEMFEAALPHFRIGGDLLAAEVEMMRIAERELPGRPDILRFRNGHGVGLSYEEPGSIAAFPQHAEPGVPSRPASFSLSGPAVFELHPNLFVPGLGGAALGDMVLVGEGEPRRLLASSLAHRLWR